MFVVVSIKLKLFDLKCRLLEKMDVGHQLQVMWYVFCWIFIRKERLFICFFRVLLIDHGMCKQINLFTVFVMNVMDAIQPYDH